MVEIILASLAFCIAAVGIRRQYNATDKPQKAPGSWDTSYSKKQEVLALVSRAKHLRDSATNTNDGLLALKLHKERELVLLLLFRLLEECAMNEEDTAEVVELSAYRKGQATTTHN